MSAQLLRADATKELPTISYGRGARLFDTEGREYIDGSSGANVANLGHGLGEIAAAAAKQIETVAYVYRTQFRNNAAEQLASTLVSLSKDKTRAFFLSSGSEAIEAAIRLVLQYWAEVGRPSKRRILSRLVSYHGNTVGALSLSSDARRQAIGSIAIEEPVVPPNYCYRCPCRTTPDVCEVECAAALEAAILRAGPDNVAAFFVEPIVGATGGAIVPHKNYFSRIREICDRYDVLLVADEVITGLGRTGEWFALHHWGVSSDVTVLGKGMNAGFTPIAAVLLNERVARSIEGGTGRVSIGHTHSGNPASAAIANAVIAYIKAHDLVARVREMGTRLGDRLRELASRHRIIGDVRGLGFLWGLEFVANRETKQVHDRCMKVTDLVTQCAFANGLVVYPCRGLVNADEGDAILVTPPLVTSEEEMGALLQRLDKTLTEVESNLPTA